jgi:hypothetical protein
MKDLKCIHKNKCYYTIILLKPNKTISVTWTRWPSPTGMQGFIGGINPWMNSQKGATSFLF